MFPCPASVLLITAVDKKSSESENEENDETYAVLGEMNQVMAENDFNGNGRNFSEERRPQVLSCGEFRKNRCCGKENVWRVGDCPGHSHGVYGAVLIHLFQHMFFLNNPSCFVSEKYAADVETDFNTDDFADPGNNNSRQKTEKNAVDGEERDCRNSEDIA